VDPERGTEMLTLGKWTETPWSVFGDMTAKWGAGQSHSERHLSRRLLKRRLLSGFGRMSRVAVADGWPHLCHERLQESCWPEIMA